MDCVTFVYGNPVELLGISIESLMDYLDDGKSNNLEAWELETSDKWALFKLNEIDPDKTPNYIKM